jgi:hypothetical protein
VSIQYLTYEQVDKNKWDTCIDSATNGCVYAYSFYLDRMAKNWDALVLYAGNQYEAVMPLTWNKKYGIDYLYQPPFTANLGVFGKDITAILFHDFLKAIPQKFKYWDIYFNHGNFFQLADFTLYQRMNYVLPLQDNYQQIYDRYKDNIKRNIKKSVQLQIAVQKNIDAVAVIALAKEQVHNFGDIPAAAFDDFKDLYNILYKKDKAIAYGAYTATGQLIASGIFFFSHRRAYYILVGNHPDGKTLGASHALIDAFIRDHAGQHLLLDFEGSDISSLAFFYSSFGATEEKYAAIRMNRLPALLKWMKK